MPHHLEQLLGATDVVPAVNQIELHPYFTQPDVQAADAEHGILTQAWSPIGGITFYPGWGEDRRNVMEDPTIAAHRGKRTARRPAQVMLRWHLQQGRSAIPKSTNPARIAENFDVFDFELSADELAAHRRARHRRAQRTGPGRGPRRALRHGHPRSLSRQREGTSMEYRPLGRTGVQVSPLCLGAMMFGPWGNDDRADSIRIIHRALDAGINFVDTADVYSGGVSEEIVGQALEGRRDDVFLATKFFMPMDEDDPNQRGGSRRWIIREVENSLRRLDTDYIDLYQVHRPSPDTDVEETLGALTDLVRQGKVRYIGSSSYSGSQIVEAQWASRDRNLERFVTEQPPYSILVRGIEDDVLPDGATPRHGHPHLQPARRRLALRPLAQGRSLRTHLGGPPERPVRHDQPGQPAQARHRRGTRPARRTGRA